MLDSLIKYNIKPNALLQIKEAAARHSTEIGDTQKEILFLEGFLVQIAVILNSVKN